jgi:hypothetical protein
MRQVIPREMFLTGGNDAVREDVPLPEYGEGVVIPVWGMTANERTKFERQFTTKDGKSIEVRVLEFRQRLVLACCKDDDGKSIFTADDVDALGKKQAAILERIVNVCQRLSGFTQADIDATVGN